MMNPYCTRKIDFLEQEGEGEGDGEDQPGRGCSDSKPRYPKRVRLENEPAFRERMQRLSQNLI